uniref:Uncharacterized protein n=1 Tax=Eutreptiella gymnastica TaxID=73025 RepID=A0A7S1IZQ0_9EUGL
MFKSQCSCGTHTGPSTSGTEGNGILSPCSYSYPLFPGVSTQFLPPLLPLWRSHTDKFQVVSLGCCTHKNTGISPLHVGSGLHRTPNVVNMQVHHCDTCHQVAVLTKKAVQGKMPTGLEQGGRPKQQKNHSTPSNRPPCFSSPSQYVTLAGVGDKNKAS